MGRTRFALLLALLLTAGACHHYTVMSEDQQARARKGDLLIDITIRHDLGGSERYVATYSVGRPGGHLLSAKARERCSSLPLAKVDELYELAEKVLLPATSLKLPNCYDCSSYTAVVRTGEKVNVLSGWLSDETAPISGALRALGVWK